MDKKKWIAMIGAGVLFLAGLLLKENVKELVCNGAPEEAPAAVAK